MTVKIVITFPAQYVCTVLLQKFENAEALLQGLHNSN